MSRDIDFTRFILFDGAMGTMLQAQGLKPGELPESYNLAQPQIVQQIHASYLAAGSDAVLTNTFGASPLKLEPAGLSCGQVVTAAVQIARRAAGAKLVALDIGPSGQLMEPYGTLSFEAAYESFAEQVIAGNEAGADLIVIETMSDVYEAKAAVLAAKENSNLPVVVTITFQLDGRTLTGTDPQTMVSILQGLGVAALGLNCSLGPKEMLPLIGEVVKYSRVPVMVQPNAGLPRMVDDRTVFDVGPEEFASYIGQMAALGVTLVGGCCGTGPDHIKAMKRELARLEPAPRPAATYTAVSSFAQTAVLGEGPVVIGERINPTGKKLLKQALISGDKEYVLREALSQQEAGATILDVNAGLVDIDEQAVMVDLIKEIQSVSSLPLQIDSNRPEVLDAACRIYSGKPLINSVSGKEQEMRELFPIARKYGAAIIGLTLDEHGIPDQAEDRLAIAAKIVETAESYGIAKQDVIIDCLVLTASAQQSQVRETLKALTLIKQRLGVVTALGVSNVSFGLPGRKLLNRTFLAAALTAGLDAPIMDPLDSDMMDTVRAHAVLDGHDRDAADYIRVYSEAAEDTAGRPATGAEDLGQLIISGLSGQAAAKTAELLAELEPMEIVNGHLIPALDVVGQRYERGELFLPQLIRSAQTVKEAFAVLKERLTSSQAAGVSADSGKVILATVHGDIHDIGKNIVKILLENYGFEVIDLGKDVPQEAVVEAVRKEQAGLVGLSTLMTTTVRSMKSTIQALKDEGLPCQVMVGGAVLNQDYIDMLGADYYGRDAREAVKIAQQVFGI